MKEEKEIVIDYSSPVVWIITIALCLFMILAIVEVGFLTYSFFSADKVECNLLWCTFTKSTVKIQADIRTECYENGEAINCSNLKIHKDYHIRLEED